MVCYGVLWYVKETKQDEAVNKAVEQAAFEAAARASHGEALLPNITMREGQKEFAATSTSSWKEQDKEPVLTEANIVAPTSGVEAGDRKVKIYIDNNNKALVRLSYLYHY